jgi:hypothetical protein
LIRNGDASLREDLERLRREMTSSAPSHKIWMLLLNGAILGVVARGFKWI